MAENTAKKILLLQGLLLVLAFGWLLFKEMPGGVREVRMWKMANLKR
jgi:hypothetical protein